MASQALYRRYRSQTFDELVGQEHIVRTLRNALAEGRIAHAYLFTGPRGVGKTTVARLLAKAVNCTASMEERPCGICDMCQAIAEGRAVDVIEMDAASHTSVEDAREIIERIQFRPTTARTKVHVIDECHMLSTAAFNALLKTLEEPPSHSLFILATTEIHKVPATILSRCQRFTFNRHGVAAMVTHMNEVAVQEGFVLEAGVPESIARAATGSMRDALSVLDQLMAYGGATITLAQVRGLLGTAESREVAALVGALLAADLSGALRAVAGVASRGGDLRQFTRDMVERLRALMLLKAGADPELLDVTEDDLVTLHAQAATGDLGQLMEWTRLFGELDHQLRTSPYGQLPLELAVVEAIVGPATHRREVAPAKPASSHPAPRPAHPRHEPEPAAPRPPTVPAAPIPMKAEPTITATSVPPVPTIPTPPTISDETPPDQPVEEVTEPVEQLQTANSEITSEVVLSANADVEVFEQVESIWPKVVRDVKARNRMIEALLNSGVKPIDVQGNVVILEVDNEFLLGRLEPVTVRTVIESVLSKYMQSPYIVNPILKEQRRESSTALREQIRNSRKDPLIKAAINIFDADIIGVEEDQ